MTGGTSEEKRMVNHVQRFRLGIALALLGLIVALIQGDFWLLEGGILHAVLTVLSIAVMLYGVVLLKRKRSV